MITSFQCYALQLDLSAYEKETSGETKVVLLRTQND